MGRKTEKENDRRIRERERKGGSECDAERERGRDRGSKILVTKFPLQHLLLIFEWCENGEDLKRQQEIQTEKLSKGSEVKHFVDWRHSIIHSIIHQFIHSFNRFLNHSLVCLASLGVQGLWCKWLNCLGSNPVWSFYVHHFYICLKNHCCLVARG